MTSNPELPTYMIVKVDSTLGTVAYRVDHKVISRASIEDGSLHETLRHLNRMSRSRLNYNSVVRITRWH